MIFDGKLPTFTTCRDCGTLMRVINAGESSHPCCATVQTQVESLSDLWVSETESGDSVAARETAELIEQVRELEIAAAAVQYADWNWPVFPLGERSKFPAIPKDKGGNGFKDATSDTARIDKWWSRHPSHNIGLATGAMFDVVDIDVKDPAKDGAASWLSLLNEHVIPECHGVAITATGGMHVYVKPTGRGCFVGIRPGIDYRGRGGYVVAPASRLHHDYRWLVEPSPIIKGDF